MLLCMSQTLEKIMLCLLGESILTCISVSSVFKGPAISEKYENVLLAAEKSKDEMIVVKSGRTRSGGHKAVGKMVIMVMI